MDFAAPIQLLPSLSKAWFVGDKLYHGASVDFDHLNFGRSSTEGQ